MRRAPTAISIGLLALIGLAPMMRASADTGATTITLNVTGCEGCTIQAFQFVNTTTKVYQSAPSKVSNGVATIGVPTARTKGMYFSIDTVKQVHIDAQPLITVQYQGVKPGTTVTKATAKASKKASACWAGTSAGTATLDITVKRILLPSFPDSSRKTSVPLAYFQPGANAYGGFDPTFKGLLATQDVWPCGPRSSNG